MGFFTRFLHQIIIIILTFVPLIESRYAIVWGVANYPELSITELFILTQVGATILALALLLLLKPVLAWMKSTKIFRKLVEWIEKHGEKKGKKLEGKLAKAKDSKALAWASIIGVFVFVAVPLPGTGVWTGSLVATLLNIRFRYAFPAVVAGSICATAIMLAIGLIAL